VLLKSLKVYIDDSKTSIGGWSQSHGNTSFFFGDLEDQNIVKSKKNLLKVDNPSAFKKSNFNSVQDDASTDVKSTLEITPRSVRAKDITKKGPPVEILRTKLHNDHELALRGQSESLRKKDLNIDQKAGQNNAKHKKSMSAVDIDATKKESKRHGSMINLKENSGSSNEENSKERLDFIPNSARATKSKKFLIDVNLDTDLSAQNIETLNASNFHDKNEASLQTWKRQLKLSTLSGGGDEGLQLLNLNMIKSCKTEKMGILNQNQYPILSNSPPLNFLKNISSEHYSASYKRLKPVSNNPPLKLAKIQKARVEEKGLLHDWKRAFPEKQLDYHSTSLAVKNNNGASCLSPKDHCNLLPISSRISEVFKKESRGGGFLFENQIKKNGIPVSENARSFTGPKRRDIKNSNPSSMLKSQVTDVDLDKKIFNDLRISFLESASKNNKISSPPPPPFKTYRGGSLQLENLEEVVQRIIKDGNSPLQKCESARHLASEKVSFSKEISLLT